MKPLESEYAFGWGTRKISSPQSLRQLDPLGELTEQSCEARTLQVSIENPELAVEARRVGPMYFTHLILPLHSPRAPGSRGPATDTLPMPWAYPRRLPANISKPAWPLESGLGSAAAILKRMKQPAPDADPRSLRGQSALPLLWALVSKSLRASQVP